MGWEWRHSRLYVQDLPTGPPRQHLCGVQASAPLKSTVRADESRGVTPLVGTALAYGPRHRRGPRPPSAHDNAAGTALLDQAAERYGMRLEKALVDQSFKDQVTIHGALPDITVEVVRRNPDDEARSRRTPSQPET